VNSERLILALDLETFSEAERMVDLLKDRISIFKIGIQLFTKVGPNAIEMVHQKGCKVFLDLKYHDIPNTVAKAAGEATKLRVFMFSIHALGGEEMMKRCRDSVVETSLNEGIKRPLVIGVTVLTSIDQKALVDLGVKEALRDETRHLSEKALTAGLDGVVTSPEEVELIRERCGKDFIIVTPGIRPEGTPIDDQKRIMTPKDAISKGANFLVIGRPILMAEDPLEAADRILKDIS
jgi:orotidine-5'-phosphate decarboxylase